MATYFYACMLLFTAEGSKVDERDVIAVCRGRF